MIGSKTAWYLVLEMNQGAKKLRIPVFEGFFFEGNINSCVARAARGDCIGCIGPIPPNGCTAPIGCVAWVGSVGCGGWVGCSRWVGCAGCFGRKTQRLIMTNNTFIGVLLISAERPSGRAAEMTSEYGFRIWLQNMAYET